jgi:hypothetical protein
MPKRDADLFESSIGQVRQYRYVDVVLGKSLSILSEAKPLQPVSDLLHRRSALDYRASSARSGKTTRQIPYAVGSNCTQPRAVSDTAAGPGEGRPCAGAAGPDTPKVARGLRSPTGRKRPTVGPSPKRHPYSIVALRLLEGLGRDRALAATRQAQLLPSKQPANGSCEGLESLRGNLIFLDRDGWSLRWAVT